MYINIKFQICNKDSRGKPPLGNKGKWLPGIFVDTYYEESRVLMYENGVDYKFKLAKLRSLLIWSCCGF